MSPTFSGRLAVVVDAEFLHRDAAFGLQADVDDREVLLDRDDHALDDRAFLEVAAAEAFVEQGREVVAGGVHAEVVSHVVFCLSSGSVAAGAGARKRGRAPARKV